MDMEYQCPNALETLSTNVSKKMVLLAESGRLNKPLITAVHAVQNGEAVIDGVNFGTIIGHISMRVRDARTNAEIIAETELDYEYVRSWSNEQTRLRIPSTVLSKVNATGVKDKSTSGVSGVRYDY